MCLFLTVSSAASPVWTISAPGGSIGKFDMAISKVSNL